MDQLGDDPLKIDPAFHLVALELLREALLLALQKLYDGGVSGIDQQAFWACVSEFENHVDIVDVTDENNDQGSIQESFIEYVDALKTRLSEQKIIGDSDAA